MIFSPYTGMMYFPHIVSNTASEVRSFTGGPVITTKLVRVHHLRWGLSIALQILTSCLKTTLTFGPTVFDTLDACSKHPAQRCALHQKMQGL